jgi:hypothetical protein
MVAFLVAAPSCQVSHGADISCYIDTIQYSTVSTQCHIYCLKANIEEGRVIQAVNLSIKLVGIVQYTISLRKEEPEARACYIIF